MIACLCLVAWGGAALGEAAASMTVEELNQAATDAFKAEDYEKALEYYQKAVDDGYEDAVERLNALIEAGQIQE